MMISLGYMEWTHIHFKAHFGWNGLLFIIHQNFYYWELGHREKKKKMKIDCLG